MPHLSDQKNRRQPRFRQGIALLTPLVISLLLLGFFLLQLNILAAAAQPALVSQSDLVLNLTLAAKTHNRSPLQPGTGLDERGAPAEQIDLASPFAGPVGPLAGPQLRGANQVLTNTGPIRLNVIWNSNETGSIYSVAWGDVDGDGDLDLATGSSSQNTVYLNEGRALQLDPAWLSNDYYTTYDVAWGDVDGDGDLDLAAGNWNDPNTVYLNEGGQLQSEPAWTSNDSDETRSVAWGDIDGDGDLDLAAGNSDGGNKVYLNEGGQLQKDADWLSNDNEETFSVA